MGPLWGKNFCPSPRSERSEVVGRHPRVPSGAIYPGNAPLTLASRTRVYAGRGDPSGLSIAHQYSSRFSSQVGSHSVHSDMTPIHGLQFSRANVNAWTMLSAFLSSETANQAYAGWTLSEVQPHSTSQICFAESRLSTIAWRSCSTRRK